MSPDTFKDFQMRTSRNYIKTHLVLTGVLSLLLVGIVVLVEILDIDHKTVFPMFVAYGVIVWLSCVFTLNRIHTERKDPLISEGTISVLIGSHSIFHNVFVLRAWWKLYGRPSFKEVVCIFLHDIGYVGMNHLIDKSNAGHAELGANVAGWLFGEDYKLLCLGHSTSAQQKFNIPPSKLEKADAYSWLLAPDWWYKFVGFIEGIDIVVELWKQGIWDQLDGTSTMSGTELLASCQEKSKKENS